MRAISEREATDLLRRGAVVVLPTETSYGLIARADNEQAVRRIFLVKGRPEHKPLPLIVGNKHQAEKIALFSPWMQALADAYWPGPLTLVLPVRAPFHLAQGIKNSADDTVAVRVSSEPLVQTISLEIGVPLVATSANRSGEESAFSPKEFLEQWAHSSNVPDGYVDHGVLPRSLPSTIIKEDTPGVGRILRQGALDIDVTQILGL